MYILNVVVIEDVGRYVLSIMKLTPIGCHKIFNQSEDRKCLSSIIDDKKLGCLSILYNIRSKDLANTQNYLLIEYFNLQL